MPTKRLFGRYEDASPIVWIHYTVILMIAFDGVEINSEFRENGVGVG